MNKNFLFLIFFLSLSGCVTPLMWDDTAYWNEDFPDIRTVPDRVCANATRCIYDGDEKISRLNAFKKLEQEREQITARDQALREKAFQSSE